MSMWYALLVVLLAGPGFAPVALAGDDASDHSRLAGEALAILEAMKAEIVDSAGCIWQYVTGHCYPPAEVQQILDPIEDAIDCLTHPNLSLSLGTTWNPQACLQTLLSYVCMSFQVEDVTGDLIPGILPGSGFITARWPGAGQEFTWDSGNGLPHLGRYVGPGHFSLTVKSNSQVGCSH